MGDLPFELTNEQRRYFGIEQIEDHWDCLQLSDTVTLFFENDILRKQIVIGDASYREISLSAKTAKDRTILLPKTSRGKPKKLNASNLEKLNGVGPYFAYGWSGVRIGNYTSQTTLYESYGTEPDIEGFNELRLWVERWVSESMPEDMKEVDAFKSAQRKHCKYKAGDFFAFKQDRHRYGFGRILLDVHAFRKQVKAGKVREKHYGLMQLMGRALIVKIYKTFSDTVDADLNELSSKPCFPSQPIMDNALYYGDYPIIGHAPLAAEELEFPISYSRSISALDPETVYLQYGLIYCHTSKSEFDRYLIDEDTFTAERANPYRNESIGFGLDCKRELLDLPETPGSINRRKHDLRSPENHAIKHEIFSFFGLDADKSYAENYQIYMHVRNRIVSTPLSL